MTKNNIKQPSAAANEIVQVWRQYSSGALYPIDVEQIINGFINSKFKKEAITIYPRDCPNMDGALIKQDNGGWGLVYNQKIINEGRRNFTIAHELGHYICHRWQKDNFECGEKEFYGSPDQIEQEANKFASYLLMPIDDFRKQINENEISFEIFRYCSDRYRTSLTACILKWLEFTPKCAVLITSVDDFVLWSRSSDIAFKNGIFFKSGIELPELSLARKKDYSSSIKILPRGVWHDEYTVEEISFYSNIYDQIFTLLIFKGVNNIKAISDEEEVQKDCVDFFNR